jgi:hypothetical protein
MATSDMLVHMKFGTYIFFGTMCVFGALFITFFVPETKGRSLEEMDELFEDEDSVSKADKERMDRIWAALTSNQDVLVEKSSIMHIEKV